MIPTDDSTFAPGIRLLPGEVREDVRKLYSLLRIIDDLVDEGHEGAPDHVEAVALWARGEPHVATAETRALADLALRHPLSRDALLSFCEGMRHDIARAGIDTEEELELYCQRVGGSVGILLANILGSDGQEAHAKIAALGRAVQRTNILRDIDEDLSRGQIYIACTTIERFGFPSPGAREELLRDQIRRADELYVEGFQAMPLLRRGQRATRLSALLYREILRQIEREGFGRRAGRVIVPAWRQRALHAKQLLHQLNRST